MAESPRVIDNVEISKRHFLSYAAQLYPQAFHRVALRRENEFY